MRPFTITSLRPPRRLPPLRLKTRLSVGALVLVLVTTFVIATAALHLVKKSMTASIASEQFARLSSIADAIDQKFISRRLLLTTFGDSIEAHGVGSPAPLQPLLEKHRSLKEAFDNVAFVDREGNLVANLNGTQSIGRLNVRDRPYFSETIATSAGLISQPFRNRVSGIAQVAMTEPILDRQGRVLFVLMGFINLPERNFLGELADVKFGQSGYMFILNTDGIVIDHPRKSRILKHHDAEGASSAASERALAGFEGTSETVSRSGVHGLYAHKRIRQTNWILGAIYPRDEAFAAIETVERAAWAGALLLALLAGGLALAVIHRQMVPLGRLHAHMLAAGDTAVYTPIGPGFSSDEIGDLARTFDALMRQRQASADRVRISERHLREVLTHAGDAFVSIDRSGAITEWNRQAEATFGWSRADIVGRQVAALMSPEELQAGCRHTLESFMHTGRGALANARVETWALHRDGRRIPVELSAASVDMGDHVVVNAFLRDITARKKAEARLQSSENRLKAITDNVPVLIAYIDQQHTLAFANKTFKEWMGVDPSKAVGRPLAEVLDRRAHAQRLPHLESALRGERVEFEVESSISGLTRQLHVTYVPDVRPDGSVAGVYSLSTDVTAMRLVEQHLDRLARVDTLTGLPNRREFELRLEQAMARCRRSKRPMALVFLDVDRFKQINDGCGHGVGDLVLRELASRLQHAIRTTDTAARLAGDEFVVILEGLNAVEEAGAVALKLGQEIRQPMYLEGQTLEVTASMGFAYFEGIGGSVEALLARADKALYRAKAAGRDAFAVTTF